MAVAQLWIVRRHNMRLIFVIITLLGAVTFGYGVTAAWHFQNGMADVNQTLFSKTEAVVTYDGFKKIGPLLDKLAEQHTRDRKSVV